MNNFEEFKQHCIDCYPQEACGYIENGTFFPLENIHSDPTNSFLLSEEDSFMLLEKNYKFIHSHTMERFTDDPRTPSKEDMIGQQNTGKVWGIVHCNGKDISNIAWVEDKENLAPLIGRNYLFNIHDCYTLCRDYYIIEKGLDVMNPPKSANWYEENPLLLENCFAEANFTPLREGEIPEEGDVIAFAIGSRFASHLGIYIGNDRFIHHLYARKSDEDSLSKWHRQVKAILRYRGSYV